MKILPNKNKDKLAIIFILVLLLVGCTNAKENSSKKEKLDKSKPLPIGTVVKLKQMKKSVMIYGYNQIQVSTGKQYDYIAVPYPEGNISPDYNVFFNRNFIEKVMYGGYDSEEGKKLRKKVESNMKEN
ncbi:DUF4176 domain-containing protein [Fictibacillus sp. JL2B1089]|uniref:DUF4176 domain-containing protein n=1 Tax=Fictibacillus sp. JL2B1089 TaxID=3399565 RepID=UPI003A8BB286